MNQRLQALRRKSLGIGLLEAIAALTILAVASAMLFSWASQSAAQLQRWKASESMELATLEALRFVESVNPSRTPSGSAKLADFQLSWESTPEGAAKFNTNTGGQLRAFEITPFLVKVSVARNDGGAWFDFSIRANGVRLVPRAAGGPWG